MRVGIVGGEPHGPQTFEQIRAMAERTEASGLDSYWVVNLFGHEALASIAAIGMSVPRIELGTNIVQVYSRHPFALAQQAATVQAALGGRLALGVGPSHAFVVEGTFGSSYATPRRYTSEYLDVLVPLLRGEAVDVAGAEVRSRGQLSAPDLQPVPVLLAALRPAMLELAGRLTEGTTTWLVGPDSLRSEVVPRLNEAAAAAGRPEPRVLASVPVCVTDDVDAATQRAVDLFGIYAFAPAYQASLARDGKDKPEEAAVIGTEEQVAAELARYRDAGVTDLGAVVFGATREDEDRTWALLETVRSEEGAVAR